MVTPEYAVEYVVDASQLAEAFAVRLQVFVGEQGVPEDEEFDDDDFAVTTTHVVVRDLETGEVVGTARLLAEDNPGEYRIGRVAVLPAARQQGVGKRLMKALERRALLSSEPVTIFLSAQMEAARFYEKLGYQLIGPMYDDVGIPHRDAIKFLTGSA